MGWLQTGVFSAFPRDEGVRSPAFLDSVIPLEGALQVVIDQEADSHDFLVLHLTNQGEQLGFHGSECVDQIV